MLSQATFDHFLKKLRYQDCKLEGHFNEPKSRICAEPGCDNNRFCVLCSMCEQLNHKDHQTLPLKSFLQQINEKFAQLFQGPSHSQATSSSDGKNNTNPLYYTAMIDEQKIKFKKNLHQQRGIILEMFEEVELQASSFFDRIGKAILVLLKGKKTLHQSLIVEVEATITCQQDNHHSSSLKRHRGNPRKFGFDNFLKGYLPLFDMRQDKFSLAKKLEELLEQSYTRGSKLITTCVETIKTIRKSTNQLIQLFQKPFYKEPIPFYRFQWSNINKPAFMKLTGRIIQQTQLQSASLRFALMQPNFNKLNTQHPIIWAVKIHKIQSWIGVGICMDNKIIASNFVFNYTTLGHCSYLISHDGHNWSHLVSSDNSAMKSFSFISGDIIYMRYDIVGKKIWFNKNAGTQNMIMSVSDPPPNNSYCPCVVIGNIGDSVEIVNIMEYINWPLN